MNTAVSSPSTSMRNWASTPIGKSWVEPGKHQVGVDQRDHVGEARTLQLVDRLLAQQCKLGQLCGVARLVVGDLHHARPCAPVGHVDAGHQRHLGGGLRRVDDALRRDRYPEGVVRGGGEATPFQLVDQAVTLRAEEVGIVPDDGVHTVGAGGSTFAAAQGIDRRVDECVEPATGDPPEGRP